jgi:hypothetical protein
VDFADSLVPSSTVPAGIVSLPGASRVPQFEQCFAVSGFVEWHAEHSI